MGSGTNFNKEILAQAAADLVRVQTTSTASVSLKNKEQASDITGDVSAMDDSQGGWSYLEQQITNVSSSVSQYITQLQTAVEAVHAAMQASVGTLTSADTDSKAGVNASDPQSSGQAPKGMS